MPHGICGRWRLGRVLGRGSTATVYEAHAVPGKPGVRALPLRQQQQQEEEEEEEEDAGGKGKGKELSEEEEEADGAVLTRAGGRSSRGSPAVKFTLLHEVDAESAAAVKIVSKAMFDPSDDGVAERRVRHEMQVMARLAHGNIVRCLETQETASTLVIVMERAENGTLFDLIVRRRYLAEATAQVYFRQLLSAMRYCWEAHGIVNRDLKPENVLMDKEWNVKLSDFGYCAELHAAAESTRDPLDTPAQLMHMSSSGSLVELSVEDFAKHAPPPVPSTRRRLKTPCGSPTYAAPEVYRGDEYGSEVDVWSLGVILFVMITGTSPWGDEETIPMRRIAKRIQRARYPRPTFVSPACQQVLAACLQAEASARPTLADLWEHPWVQSSREHVDEGEVAAAETAVKSDADAEVEEEEEEVEEVQELAPLEYASSYAGSDAGAHSTTDDESQDFSAFANVRRTGSVDYTNTGSDLFGRLGTLLPVSEDGAVQEASPDTAQGLRHVPPTFGSSSSRSRNSSTDSARSTSRVELSPLNLMRNRNIELSIEVPAWSIIPPNQRPRGSSSARSGGSSIVSPTLSASPGIMPISPTTSLPGTTRPTPPNLDAGHRRRRSMDRSSMYASTSPSSASGTRSFSPQLAAALSEREALNVSAQAITRERAPNRTRLLIGAAGSSAGGGHIDTANSAPASPRDRLKPPHMHYPFMRSRSEENGLSIRGKSGMTRPYSRTTDSQER